MKEITGAISTLTPKEIAAFENRGNHSMTIGGNEIVLTTNDVEIISEDIPGWQVANDGKLTVALDITVTDTLRYEGIARELVNRIQNIRKENGFDVTDKITVLIADNDLVHEAVIRHSSYIGSQTLANEVSLSNELTAENAHEVEIEEVAMRILVRKSS
jgi:isoleucyl-tRNA synthetase